jgi:hypothetical protein
MAARRTASQIATLAALAVASFGGTVAHSASASASNRGFDAFVIVLGGRVFTIDLPGWTGITQMGGGG